MEESSVGLVSSLFVESDRENISTRVGEEEEFYDCMS